MEIKRLVIGIEYYSMIEFPLSLSSVKVCFSQVRIKKKYTNNSINLSKLQLKDIENIVRHKKEMDTKDNKLKSRHGWNI